MSSEWALLTFSDAPFSIIDGDRGTNYPKQHDFSATGHCLFLNAGNVTKDGFSFTDCAFISEEKDLSLRKGKLQRHDIVLTTRGTVGNVAYYSDGIKFESIRINSGMVIFRPDSSKILPYYLYLFLRSSSFAEQVKSLTSGSAQPQLPIRDMNRITIPVPSLEIQAEICFLLGAVDDRIALLRETNATLEAIAQALFKSWFVDFDPVHANAGSQAPSLPPEIQALFPATFIDSHQGPIPEGWSYVNLGELVCNQSTTFRFHGIDKVVFINTGDVSEGLFLHQDYVSTDGLPGQAKKAIQRDDILFSEIRPKNKRFAYVNLDPKDYVVSTKFMVLRAISDISPRYIYQILKQDETIDFFNMIAESRSGTFPQITFDSIQTYQVLKPSKACVDKFIDLVSPIIEQIDLISERQKELATLRDALLPRLISGQLRLPEAEKAIAAITD